MTDRINIPQAIVQSIRIEVARRQRAQDNIDLMINTLGHALGVPAGWYFDVNQAAFVPPQGSQIIEATPQQLAGAVPVTQEELDGLSNDLP